MSKRNPDKDKLSISLVIDIDLLDKFRVAVSYNERNINQQLRSYMRSYVSAFEKEHGPITDEMISQVINKKQK